MKTSQFSSTHCSPLIVFFVLGTSLAYAQITGPACDDPAIFGPPLPGDYNFDGARDLLDLPGLQACLTGSELRPPSGCYPFEIDGDLDIDVRDFLGAQVSFSGELVTPDPTGLLDPICPISGATVNTTRPAFSATPVDYEATYQLTIWKLPHDSRSISDVMNFLPPTFVVSDLAAPSLSYPDTFSPLIPGETYVWQVTAFNSADVNKFSVSGPAALVTVDDPSPEEQLAELLKRLAEIQKALTGEIENLNDNPLVKEVRLIEAFIKLLSNLDDLDDEAIAALEAFLSCDTTAMGNLSPEVLDALLSVLQGVLEFIIQGSDDLSEAQKTVLRSIINAIEQVRAGTANLASIKAILGEDGWNPIDYLRDSFEGRVSEAIEEAAKKALAKLIGAKAAGAIFSMLSDLLNFLDVLEAINTIENLWDALNELYLQAACKANGMDAYRVDPSWTWINRFFFMSDWSDFEGKTVRLNPVLRCFDPDLPEGQSRWVDEPLTFSDQGDTTYSSTPGEKLTFSVSDMEMETIGEEPNTRTTCKYKFSLNIPNAAALTGKDPCMIIVTQTITGSDQEPLVIVQLTGVIKRGGGSSDGNGGASSAATLAQAPTSLFPPLEFTVSVTSGGASTVIADTGASVPYEVTGLLLDGNNEGLAGFTFDLCFDGVPLTPADVPADFPMTQFVSPDGLSNPGGYGGSIVLDPAFHGESSPSGCLLGVGGAQNTINNGDLALVPNGTVTTDVARTSQTLVTGTLSAPMVPGTYTLATFQVAATAIVLGETGIPFWETKWIKSESASTLTVIVEGVPPETLLPEPGGLDKNRFLSFVVPSGVAVAVAEATAIQIELTTLNHMCSADSDNLFEPCTTDGDCIGDVCEAPFSASEGQVRYVNVVKTCQGAAMSTGEVICRSLADCAIDEECLQFRTCDGTTDLCATSDQCDKGVSCLASMSCPDDVYKPPFLCATTGCEPEYRNWASDLAGGVLYVYGPGIVPARSEYNLRQIPAACAGNEASCAFVSDALMLATARWADMTADGATNAQDIAAASDKVKPVPEALTKPRTMLIPGILNPFRNVNVLELQNTVDAVKSLPMSGFITGPEDCGT